MSSCIPINGKEIYCYGCGKPVTDHKNDPDCFKKRHITVHLTLSQRPLYGLACEQLHNPHYEFTVHNHECLQKVDWQQVKRDVAEVENISRFNKSKLTGADIEI